MPHPPLEEMIAAARAAPRDVAPLRDLVNAAGRRGTDPMPAVDYIAGLDPKPFDKFSRNCVASFLVYAQRADLAMKWRKGWF